MLAFSRPLPPVGVPHTTCEPGHAGLPVSAPQQLVKQLPGPRGVQFSPWEKPPVPHCTQPDLEGSQLRCQPVWKRHYALTPLLVELVAPTDAGRIDHDVRPSQTSNGPDACPRGFGEHQRELDPTPACSPAFLRSSFGQPLQSLANLNKPVVGCDWPPRILLFGHFQSAQRVLG